MNTPPRLRVLLADPDRRVRNALGELLSAEPDLDICASVGTVSAALEHLSAEPPDVALMDVLLPGPADGLKLLAALQRLGVPAVVLTAASSLRNQTQQSAATAFLEKDGQVDGIVSALRSACSGRRSTALPTDRRSESPGRVRPDRRVYSMDMNGVLRVHGIDPQ